MTGLLPPSFLLALMLLSTLASSEEQTVLETFTVEKRGIAGWETEAASCKYAIIDAQVTAKSRCDKNHGKVKSTLSTECGPCKETEYFNEWYCTGAATIQCEYQSEKPNSGIMNGLRKLLYDSNGNPYTESNNPCTQDTQTKACQEYRSAKKLAGDSRG